MKTLLPWPMILGLSLGQVAGSYFSKIAIEDWPTNKSLLFGSICGVVCVALCSLFRVGEWLAKKWRSPSNN